MIPNLKEIMKILIFINNAKVEDLARKTGLSGNSIHNFLIRRTVMKMSNMSKIFNVLNFDFVKAVELSEQNLTRKELIKKIIEE